MTKRACSDEEFIKIFQANGATESARILGVSERSVHYRRKSVERKSDRVLVSPNAHGFVPESKYPNRLKFRIADGVIMVGSDAHIWPMEASTAMRAWLGLAGGFRPVAQVFNGDLYDGPRKYPLSTWSARPSTKQELSAIQETLDCAERASPQSRMFWLLGNHDYRFEAKLAQHVPENEGVAGFALQDHFPRWKMGISLWVNDDVVIKHRFKGGIHAAHNNTLWSGKTMITGHLHSLKVTPFDDYNGTRYGVDTGTLADLDGPQFDYGEDNPANHRSGFVILTFAGGRLLWPEVVRVMDKEHVEFRGKIIKV